MFRPSGRRIEVDCAAPRLLDVPNIIHLPTRYALARIARRPVMPVRLVVRPVPVPAVHWADLAVRVTLLLAIAARPHELPP